MSKFFLYVLLTIVSRTPINITKFKSAFLKKKTLYTSIIL